MTMVSRPGTARAQPGVDDVFEIPVHPEVPTIMHLPDEITRARVNGSSIRVTRAGRVLHVRPRPDVPAGLEALLEVETMTMLLTFRLRVVERFRDAREELVVMAVAPERAQSAMDVSPVILVHPRVTTMLLLPDEIVHTWIDHRGQIRVARIGNEIAIRPRAGTPAGVEASLEVETRTVHRTFRLRVVARFSDAHEELVVVVMKPEQLAEERPLELDTMLGGGHSPDIEPAPGAEPAKGDEHDARIETRPNTRGATTTLTPRPAEPAERRESAPDSARDAVTGTPRDTLVSGSSTFDVTVHAVAGFPGFTALHVAGYEPIGARQPHLAFGARVSGARPGAPWAVEAGISGEWPLAPTVHIKEMSPDQDEVVELGGPWLRMDVGLQGHLGTRWRPTVQVGAGLQVHFRNVERLRYDVMEPGKEPGNGERLGFPERDMPFSGALVFGMGFEHRRKDMLIGILFQVRQGIPAEYRSVTMLLSWGVLLDQGE